MQYQESATPVRTKNSIMSQIENIETSLEELKAVIDNLGTNLMPITNSSPIAPSEIIKSSETKRQSIVLSRLENIQDVILNLRHSIATINCDIEL